MLVFKWGLRIAPGSTRSTLRPNSASSDSLSPEKGLERQRIGRSGIKLDQKIEIAALGIEIVTRRRAEKVEPPNVEPAE
jgi:hypothetical protein